LSKVMAMQEAVSRFVHRGDTVFISGCQHGEPAAAVYEIIRQRIDHLTVVAALVGSMSMMMGEGLLDKIITGYFPQDEKQSYTLVKARETGHRPIIEEYSHFGISMALFAGQIGIPFMPTKAQLGSDMLKYNDSIKEFACPFSGSKLVGVKAVVPDVALFHTQRCDADGNAQKWGSLGIDQEGVNASRNIIVTTEKIVDSDIIQRDPNRTVVPGFRVSAVVEQPFGAFPMHLAGCYNGDNMGMMRSMAGPEGYESFVKKYIYGVKDFNQYLSLLASEKGKDYFENLRIKNPLYSEPIVSGL
jgi:glutaconate CoA-transferase, subunit A